jgi:aspartyl protease family protein
MTNSDLPQIIYLVALLAFLLSSFFFNKQIKASKVFAQLSIWLVITFILIAIYSFRFEFLNLKQRVAGELFPSKISRIGERKLAIKAANDGHFYINILVNGKKIRFMVDTGASDIVLNYSDAQKLGINFKEISSFRRYQTANGFVVNGMINIEEMQLENIKFNNIQVAVSSKDIGNSLLGMSFLSQFEKYEFYQNNLVLSYAN